MQFYPTNEYREVTLQAGLNSVHLDVKKHVNMPLKKWNVTLNRDGKG